AARFGNRGKIADYVHGCKFRISQIALVVPCSGLLSEDASNSFAVQVNPSIVGLIQPNWQVFQTVSVDELDGWIDLGLAIGEFDRREGSGLIISFHAVPQ